MTTDSAVWKFGFGSNMSPTILANKKNVQVLDYKPAIVKGWILSFNLGPANAKGDRNTYSSGNII
jgi:hypothetical protein